MEIIVGLVTQSIEFGFLDWTPEVLPLSDRMIEKPQSAYLGIHNNAISGRHSNNWFSTFKDFILEEKVFFREKAPARSLRKTLDSFLETYESCLNFPFRATSFYSLDKVVALHKKEHLEASLVAFQRQERMCHLIALQQGPVHLQYPRQEWAL